MGLTEYKRKRNFKATPEPEGKVAEAKGNSFVIQKHAATRLHYDFRLEMEGVLRSWAVPKGPSLDPGEKRLAVHVEDHPLDYGGFEGIIPKGQYGGGTVLLWDRGVWTAEGDPVAAYKKGHLKFRLEGEKLHGGWNLVRMGRRAQDGEHENWLLIKENDETAVPGSGEAVVEQYDRSVDTGLNLEEIAAASPLVLGIGKEAFYAQIDHDQHAAYNYAKTVLDLMLRAPMHPDGKVLFIGGGIANFTNVASTFKGVIRALREVAPVINEHKVQIWVRRAGPNYQEGLKNIKSVGAELGMDMHVYGPEMHVSGIVPLALQGKKTDVKEFGEA